MNVCVCVDEVCDAVFIAVYAEVVMFVVVVLCGCGELQACVSQLHPVVPPPEPCEHGAYMRRCESLGVVHVESGMQRAPSVCTRRHMKCSSGACARVQSERRVPGGRVVQSAVRDSSRSCARTWTDTLWIGCVASTGPARCGK